LQTYFQKSQAEVQRNWNLQSIAFARTRFSDWHFWKVANLFFWTKAFVFSRKTAKFRCQGNSRLFLCSKNQRVRKHFCPWQWNKRNTLWTNKPRTIALLLALVALTASEKWVKGLVPCGFGQSPRIRHNFDPRNHFRTTAISLLCRVRECYSTRQ